MTTILGIDPGTAYMGVAVLKGRQLIASGVHTLRNGNRPYDTIGQARRVLLRPIAHYRPDIVAIEKPLRPRTKRAALLTVIVEELAVALGADVEAVCSTPPPVSPHSAVTRPYRGRAA
jgi:RNase H-fold protein (predicted Holliday junction resolvase)